MDILGFGAISMDHVIYVDQPLSSGKGRVTRRITAHGGNVATALVTAARLGASAGFVGWLNSDTEQDPSSRDLLANGVDISHAPKHPDATAVQSTITVGPDGERFIAYDDDVMIGTTPDLPDDLLRAARVLLIDGYAVSSLDVVSRASRLGLPIVADIEWTAPSGTDRLLDLADHLVLPMGYARQHTGCVTPGGIASAFWTPNRTAVVLTDGEAGSHVLRRGHTDCEHIPAFKTPVIDTTGAGDCFHGAYAVALSEGRDILDCVRFASASAALSVTGRGGREALPTRDAVERLMAEKPNVSSG